jgi:hypothetical protein
MSGIVPIPDGMVGFDCDVALTGPQAETMVAAGFGFVMRYIRRDQPADSDLTIEEIALCHAAGLAVGVVQHVAPPPWSPEGALGLSYGETAVVACQELLLPSDLTIGNDLESVTAKPADVIAFCNAWFDALDSVGYVPGQYVGYGCGLTREELFYNLKVARFWAAYNLNDDQVPAVRGVCLRQHVAESPGVPFSFQNDTARADALGGRWTVFAPDGWGSPAL